MKSAPEGARYAAAYDSNYDADAIADLFTEDAVWDGDKLARRKGAKISVVFSAGPRDVFPLRSTI
jgi:hypothetical protein